LLERHPNDILRLDLDAFDLAPLGDVRVLAVRNRHEIRRIAVVLVDFYVVDRTDVVISFDRSNRDQGVIWILKHPDRGRCPRHFLRVE
jgi:hypothetical protein